MLRLSLNFHSNERQNFFQDDSAVAFLGQLTSKELIFYLTKINSKLINSKCLPGLGNESIDKVFFLHSHAGLSSDPPQHPGVKARCGCQQDASLVKSPDTKPGSQSLISQNPHDCPLTPINAHDRHTCTYK